MRIGIIAEPVNMDSMRYVYGLLEKVLKGYQIIHRPHDYHYSPASRQEKMAEEFLLKCDVTIGQIEPGILQARERLGKHVPMVGFLLGSMSRGANNIASLLKYLKTTDVLIGNCNGDVEIARKFLSNGQIRWIPFAFDETAFYPIAESKRVETKKRLGFKPDDKILVYAGRLTLEKNVHTLLRVFSVLQDLMPNVHLLIAGKAMNYPFQEYGVYPIDIMASLTKAVKSLGLSKDRVRFLGSVGAHQLRYIYNISDAMVNLTIHHDENFGYAQVEAMACGTPVIGTNWGGLKDTILDNETGYHVSVAVTDSGLKVDWWEAVNNIMYLLNNDSERERLRARWHSYAIENYSLSRCAQHIRSILSECVERHKGPGEPLDMTGFARQFWYLCGYRNGDRPPYRRSPRAAELYKELITPFTGTTKDLSPDDAITPDQILVLAAPVEIVGETVQINDIFYPYDIPIPEAHRKICKMTLEAMAQEPVIQVDRLLSKHLDGLGDWAAALAWMLRTGILMLTYTDKRCVDPASIGPQMGMPIFGIQKVDYTTDVVVVG